MSKQDHTRAMDAVGVARSVHEEAWTKLGKVIAQKLVDGKSTDQESRLRTRASRQITRYNRRLLELKAAASIVAAPTAARIKEVRALIAKVRDLAVKDAAMKAGFKTLKDALNSARDLAKEAKAS